MTSGTEAGANRGLEDGSYDGAANIEDDCTYGEPELGNPNMNPNPNLDQEESGEELEGDNYFADLPSRHQRGPIEDDRRRLIEDDKRRWESGMRTEILEFHGSLKPEEFLNWLATIDEILEFKGVLEDKRVPLVAIRLRDRATTWWQQIQDIVNMFDQPSVSTANQRALQVKKQFRRNSNFGNSFSVGRNSGASRSGGGGCSSRVNRPRRGANKNTASTSQSNRPTGSGMRCFGCGEIGHRQSECRKTASKKTLFIDTEDGEEEDVEESEDPIFDCEEVIDEGVVTGDRRTALVVRCSCLTPKVADDNWLRHNIFQSTCTVIGNVCRFVIDAGSCEMLHSDASKMGI
ncbi:hypothetical protein CRG98_011760 [Punica granatum]|uniref:CCHC-type domain-containing protein n=1 Tax=Punica granatum TaxID=22663 RepID=A0A2I0KHB1_PUNGR|nr:hypothetical protein CRG98_011760 [Punica granatum]